MAPFFTIQTAAMDGETDLKTRVIPGPCHGLTSAQLLNIKVCNFTLLHTHSPYDFKLIFALFEKKFVKCSLMFAPVAGDDRMSRAG